MRAAVIGLLLAVGCLSGCVSTLRWSIRGRYTQAIVWRLDSQVYLEDAGPIAKPEEEP